MNLAVRDVQHNLLRFCLTALGIGLLTAGSLTINGIYNGIVDDALNLVDKISTDLWVVQQETTGPFAETSTLPAQMLETIRAVSGVAEVRRFDMLQTSLVSGRGGNVTLMPLDYPADAGADLPLVAGRPLAALRGEVIADRETGQAPGDQLVLGDELYTVVGLADGLTETNGEPVIALSSVDFEAVRQALRRSESRTTGYSDPAALWPRPANLSAILVDLLPGGNPGLVAERIARTADVAVLTSEDQHDLIINGRLARMRLQILIFSTLLTAITAVVVTLTIYTLTIEKQHTIALLKLVGASSATIAGLILTQSLLLAALGYAMGVGLETLIAPLFPRRVVVLPTDLAVLALSVAVTCLVGSLLGIFKAMQVRAQEILS